MLLKSGRGEGEERKTRPASSVQNRGPVLGKSVKSGSGALRPSSSFRRFASRFLVEDYEKRREDERDEETGMGFGV